MQLDPGSGLNHELISPSPFIAIVKVKFLPQIVFLDSWSELGVGCYILVTSGIFDRFIEVYVT